MHVTVVHMAIDIVCERYRKKFGFNYHKQFYQFNWFYFAWIELKEVTTKFIEITEAKLLACWILSWQW